MTDHPNSASANAPDKKKNSGARQSGKGIVPEGVWVLDQERSKKLVPCSHTLWVIKDDGEELTWVSVETGEDDVHKITSWTGYYDGEPSTVSGSGFVANLRALGPDEMETYGDIPEMGPFSEICKVDPSGKKMVCNGRVETKDGVITWHEVFDLRGPSPHLPLKQGD